MQAGSWNITRRVTCLVSGTGVPQAHLSISTCTVPYGGFGVAQGSGGTGPTEMSDVAQASLADSIYC